MKKSILSCLLLPLLLACNEREVSDTTNNFSPGNTPEASRDTCLVSAEVMEGNRYLDYTAGEQVLLRSSNGPDWQLEVYDLFDCTRKAVYPLPPNASPDYPYFLADINYNTSQRMVGVRGYDAIYVIDLDRRSILKDIEPAFKGERLKDTESGTILHLEVWEDYLVGMTQDWGAFVFALDSGQVRPVMPVAELPLPAGGYQSLFLIGEKGDTYQAILPVFSATSGEFQVNPLFPAPVALLPAETVYAEGSPYVRLRKPDNTLIGVDMYTGELLPVIEEKDI